MSEIENISGQFTITLGGVPRRMKCTFGAIENIEQHVVKKSILKLFSDVQKEDIFISDVVSVIWCGLAAAGDTRLSRKEIGDMIYAENPVEAFTVYIQFLTYALNGGKKEKETPAKGEA